MASGGADPVAILGLHRADVGVNQQEVVVGHLEDDGVAVHLHGGRTALIHQFHAEILPNPVYHFSKRHLISFLLSL